jgi:hypothetical protein
MVFIRVFGESADWTGEAGEVSGRVFVSVSICSERIWRLRGFQRESATFLGAATRAGILLLAAMLA